jgi:hypothetical protein
MTDSAFDQSLSQLTQGSYSDSFSRIESTYSHLINLYSSCIIAPSLAILSSVFALIDQSHITRGIDILSSLTGTTIGSKSLSTSQSAESMYYWNEMIGEGTAADTGDTEQWLSYSGCSALSEEGMNQYSRLLKKTNDAILFDREAWSTINVSTASLLPVVECEPTV